MAHAASPETPATGNKYKRMRAVAAALIAAGMAPLSMAAPASGDTYAYRHVNGYNHEVRGRIEYRVEKVDADRVAVSFTTDSPSLQAPMLEIYTPDGNWLRHSLVSHHRLVEYQFSKPYPAYAQPLDPGKSWSARVPATVVATGEARTVIVEGKVLGAERVRVPAGEFDTLKIRRVVYVGDSKDFEKETQVVEYEWFAPSLGRAVRAERRSTFLDTRMGRANMVQNGDWDVFELETARR